jgi:hypothetical protein
VKLRNTSCARHCRGQAGGCASLYPVLIVTSTGTVGRWPVGTQPLVPATACLSGRTIVALGMPLPSHGFPGARFQSCIHPKAMDGGPIYRLVPEPHAELSREKIPQGAARQLAGRGTAALQARKRRAVMPVPAAVSSGDGKI